MPHPRPDQPLTLLVRIPPDSPFRLSAQSTGPEDGAIVRIVGSTMAYVKMPSSSSFAFSAEDIDGYRGVPLSSLGLVEGTPVRIEVDQSLTKGVSVTLLTREP